MNIITTEMLFENNVKEIIQSIETDYHDQIMQDFDEQPNLMPDIFTWLEKHPEIVGKAFIRHLINYGFTNEDIS